MLARACPYKASWYLDACPPRTQRPDASCGECVAARHGQDWVVWAARRHRRRLAIWGYVAWA